MKETKTSIESIPVNENPAKFKHALWQLLKFIGYLGIVSAALMGTCLYIMPTYIIVLAQYYGVEGTFTITADVFAFFVVPVVFITCFLGAGEFFLFKWLWKQFFKHPEHQNSLNVK